MNISSEKNTRIFTAILKKVLKKRAYTINYTNYVVAVSHKHNWLNKLKFQELNIYISSIFFVSSSEKRNSSSANWR